MKKSFTNWSIRLLSFGFISAFAIVLTILNPGFLYANKTEFGNYVIHHNEVLPPAFENRLTRIDELVKESEFYNPSLELNLCLNDGSVYPGLMEILRGPAFGWGFHNIATFRGDFNFDENTVELNGYKWNLEQLMTHELAHCLQFTTLGLFNSNPLADHPEWKWEGYAEYLARKNPNQLSLRNNVERIELAKAEDAEEWGIFFEDGTVAPRTYYNYWLLVQYSIDVKGMTYRDLLASTSSMDQVRKELIQWYETTSIQVPNDLD